ncbi:hypothetical protein [Nocardia camponoti]|uniref:Uncharacterized protein n=1 Tax=Nocardia camponoti TaxID=1616106 RepID=A0A917QKG2_9NOCA|nr:hypothetical protein [Nocardia camponoti]GGK54909.1 hypothetical protein GCM10011591_28490 [Nocardia camponoti]
MDRECGALIEVAAELEGYLRAASALPPPVEISGARQPAGWYVRSPEAPVEGRTPWVHMRGIAVDCVGETLILTFSWKQDAPRYVLPMTTNDRDAITGSDALITRLDFFLDTDWRASHCTNLGCGQVLVAMGVR